MNLSYSVSGMYGLIVTALHGGVAGVNVYAPVSNCSRTRHGGSGAVPFGAFGGVTMSTPSSSRTNHPAALALSDTVTLGGALASS